MRRWVAFTESRGPGFGSVLPRIMGLILAVIAVQFIIDGAEDVIRRMVSISG